MKAGPFPPLSPVQGLLGPSPLCHSFLLIPSGGRWLVVEVGEPCYP